MDKQQEKDEMIYQLSIYVAKNMLKQEIISIQDFERMNCILLEKYNPYIGELFSMNELTI